MHQNNPLDPPAPEKPKPSRQPQPGKVQPQAGQDLTPKPQTGPTTRYIVNREGLATLSHGDKIYKAVKGFIELPTGATWYADLVQAGALTPEAKDE